MGQRIPMSLIPIVPMKNKPLELRIMQKAFVYLATAALVLAGCSKAVESPVETIPENGKKTVKIIASVDDPETRTSVEIVDKKGIYSWTENETIAVVPTSTADLDGVLTFENINPDEGWFSGEMSETDYLVFAVSPQSALSDAYCESQDDLAFALTLDGSYLYSNGTNAVMVAGMPTDYIVDEDNVEVSYPKFEFKHAAALYRVVYENVPVGTQALKFEADGVNITGEFLFDSLEGVEIKQEDADDGENIAHVLLDDPVSVANTTMEFYVPVPTGYYTKITVSLLGSDFNHPIDGTERTFTANSYEVKRSALIRVPKITLDAAETLAGEWIMVGQKDSDFYAAQAFVSGNSNLKGTEVTVSGNTVTSDDYIPVKMTFTYVSEGDYAGMYTIQDANGNYLYAASSSNNYLKAKDTIDESTPEDFYWNITEGGNGVYSIIASESDNRNVLQFNGNSTLFACYATASQSGVMLYKWADANIPNPTCATPEISCQNNVITITSATAGATIYYVIGTDATVADPTTASSVYDPDNKPTISTNSYVKAIAVADGYVNSEVAGAAVTYKEPVVLAGWVETNLSEIVAGDVFVMVANEQYALPHDGSSAPVLVSVTVADSKLTAEPAANIQWNLTGNSTDGYTFYPNGNSAKYLRCKTTSSSGNNDNIRIETGDRNVFILDSGNHIVTKDSYAPRYIGINGTSNFRGYVSPTSATEACFKFFKYYDDGKQDAGISFDPASATVTFGESLTQPTLNNAHGLTVTYASSDQAVASLNGSTIVVNKAGTATITASWTEQTIDGVTYRAGSTDFALTVNKATPVVAFNNPTTTVNVGGSTVTNVASITPNTLAVTYSSSDDNVATVTAAGVVTGIAEGTATITAAFAGNDNYEAASVSYEMTVVDNRTFAVTITQPQTGGSFKVNVDGSEIATGASVQVNKTVTLTAVPATGYTLDAWTDTKTGDPTTVVAVNNDSFTMPAYAVTITASFAEIPDGPVVGDVLFSTDFGTSDSSLASYTGGSSYNNASSISYSTNNATNVKIDTGTANNMTDANLFIGNKSYGKTGLTATISGIKTYGATKVTVIWACNNVNSQVSITESSTAAKKSDNSASNYQVFSLAGTETTISIVVTGTSKSSNSRVDDIIVKFGESIPE